MEQIPTAEEYQKAKEITIVYETEQKRLFDIRVENFRIDLEEYFNNNLIDGDFKLTEFQLRSCNYGYGEIIPMSHSMDEYYEGGNDADIKKLCEKHDVKFKFPYWCYPK
jgi:hypothetical protein